MASDILTSTMPWEAELQREAGFQTLDLAERAGFIGMAEEVHSFDSRPDSEIREVACSHSDPIERERALWEYAHRKGEDAIPLLKTILDHEENAAIRWNLLWLALKVGKEQAISLVHAALSDDHREVRDWAKVYLKEVALEEFPAEYTEGTYISSSPFDQTLPLQIAGYALVDIPGMGTVRVTLSPLWFTHILGRVLACTNRDTFMKDLTIEKCMESYHPDASDHYEIFPFSGVSWRTSDERVQHRYESNTLRHFYRSGKVEDKSNGVDQEVPVILNRSASTESVTMHATSDESVTGAHQVVATVRGQFFGWAYTSLEHYTAHGKVLPGTVQLANPLHEATADMVNTYLCGTFRGKLGDYNNDGKVDINLIPCHGTPEGKVDYFADGTLKPDPYE